MSPQVQAYCAAVHQLKRLSPRGLRDRDAYPSRLQELSDMALTIARFGTAQILQEFYDLLTAEPEVAGHAAGDILQYFQPPAAIHDRAYSIIRSLPHYN